MQPQRADQAIATLVELEMDQIDVLPLAHRICELRDNLTAYEAAYLAVAEDLGCTRFTSDAAPALANGSARGVVLNSPPVVRGS